MRVDQGEVDEDLHHLEELDHYPREVDKENWREDGSTYPEDFGYICISLKGLC